MPDGTAARRGCFHAIVDLQPFAAFAVGPLRRVGALPLFASALAARLEARQQIGMKEYPENIARDLTLRLCSRF